MSDGKNTVERETVRKRDIKIDRNIKKDEANYRLEERD